MRFDFHHLTKANVTYIQHAKFALSIGFKMFFSCLFFLVHGIVPFFQIPNSFNLCRMSEYMKGKNEERS